MIILSLIIYDNFPNQTFLITNYYFSNRFYYKFYFIDCILSYHYFCTNYLKNKEKGKYETLPNISSMKRSK